MSLEGLQLGNYKLIRLIGRGGMGEVFLAQDTRIGRQVAIKIMRNEVIESPDTDEKKTAERLFQREMRIITQLDHSNILPLYDFGEEKINNDTFIYMVMPYRVDGSFANWLNKRGSSGPLAQQDVAYFINQAADALMHAHQAGIVHQDVKPPNFLIRQRSDQPRRPDLLLTDFGIARAMDATSTAVSQQIRGTPGYMAPEQWSSEPGPATDQYALAVMAYELLVGRPPFQGNSMQVMYKHLNEQPEIPSRLNPQISARIDSVLLKALSKRPQDRFSTVKAFAVALEEAIGDAPVSTPGISAVAVNNQAPPPPPPFVQVATPPPPPFVQPATTANNTPYNNSSPYYPSAAQTPGWSPPPITSDRKPRNIAGIITLVSLVIVLIVGGIIILVVRTPSPGSQGYNNPTATPSPTVDVQATQTQYSNATATVQAANALPAYMSDAATTGTLAINDSLTSSTNWLEDADDNFGGKCNYSAQAFHIVQSKLSRFYRCTTPSKTHFGNLAFQVDMTIIQGKKECGGLIFRESGVKNYYFRVCMSGEYDLFKYVSTDPKDTVTLSVNHSSTAIKKGLNVSNNVAVVVNGSSIELYINQQSIEKITDSSFSDGTIGFTAESFDTPSEVTYNNAMVWRLA